MNIDEIREEIAFRMDVDRDARFDPLNALSRTRHATTPLLFILQPFEAGRMCTYIE